MQHIMELVPAIWTTLVQWRVDTGHVKIELLGEEQGVKRVL
jgi:hypothetical protein